MKRINNTPVAVGQAVITSSGVVVGPYLTELAGFAELTPYKGGWCGNEMKPDVLTAQQRAQTRRTFGEWVRVCANAAIAGSSKSMSSSTSTATSATSVSSIRYLRRLGDHERHRRCLRRCAAVPVPPARVPRCRIRPRRQRDQRTVGGALRCGRVEPDDHQGDGSDHRIHHAFAADRSVLPRPVRDADL